MSSERRARICWLPPGAGGRAAPPTGPRYSTVARFERIRDLWPREAWSIVLTITDPAEADGAMVARIRLLSEEAPAELLAAGSRFELFEGARRVATGEVL